MAHTFNLEPSLDDIMKPCRNRIRRRERKRRRRRGGGNREEEGEEGKKRWRVMRGGGEEERKRKWKEGSVQGLPSCKSDGNPLIN